MAMLRALVCAPFADAAILPDSMEWQALVPGIVGAFVGVMGWLAVGLYIQRRQFVRQARNAAKAVYFELDVNLATIAVARDHGVFSDLDRSSYERLLPELATLLTAGDLAAVVNAYRTHAGYRQMAASDALPADVRRAALTKFVEVHARAIETLRPSAFSRAEAKVMDGASAVRTTGAGTGTAESAVRTKP
jgi:hypothetical protein